MRRIFYFSGYRMKVFEWQGRQLLGSHEFEPDQEGTAEFAEYLQNAPLVASQLLVDVIEEDFRRENIPHVNSRDRKALLTRLLDRHYRDDVHNHVLFLGRNKEGRRDDQVLLSALTNMDVLGPWLSRLEEHRVPLAGIWSLPLLIEGVVKHVAGSEPNALIVTRQIRSAQRETFFKDGKLMFSRQAKLDRDLRDDDSARVAVKNLTTGTEQIRHFLTNQRIIGFTEPLTAICLLPNENIAEASEISVDTNLIKYRFAGLQSLFRHFNLKGCEGQAADALFAYFCAQKFLFNDHYARQEQKYQFFRFAFDRSIDVVATLGALLVITAAALLWLSTAELKQQQIAAEAGRDLLARRYEKEFSQLGQSLDDAPMVLSTVQQAQKLALEARQAPRHFFAPLSRVYSQDRFAPLSLNEFHWDKYRIADVGQVIRQLVVKQPSEEGDDGYLESPEDGGEAVRALQQPVIRLVGELNRADLSYRETVTTMRDFVSALGALPEVQEIHVLRTPVDIRPEAKFSDRSGLRQDSVPGNQDADRYEILLVMTPMALEPAETDLEQASRE